MAKARPHPASVERLLGVLGEVQHGVPVQNGNGEAATANEHRFRQRGLEGFYGALPDSRSNIKDSIRECIDEIFHERRGIPSILKKFIEKETTSGVLQCRRQADELKTLVSTKAVRIARSQRVSSDFVQALKQEFGHFQSYLDGLNLPEEIVSVGNETRTDVQTLLVSENQQNNNGQHPAGSGDEVAPSDEPSVTAPEESIPQWQDPELRQLLVLESLNKTLRAPLDQLIKDLRSSSSPVIGEREEMDLVNFTVCEQFVNIVRESLDAAVSESKSSVDLELIKKKFVKTLSKKLADLEQNATKDRPHAGVIPSLKKCAESLSAAVTTLTQESIEGPQESDGASVTLDARKLLLPETAAFLERREGKEEAWQWSERDWHAFRKNFKFPEKGPELMQPLPDPTDSNLVSAAQVVNYTMRGGLKDKDGRFVILLSDAKGQIGHLRAVHAEKQIEAAIPGILQYAKDIYAECVLRHLLAAVKSSVEEKAQHREFPNGNKVYLFGKPDFQMSWVPALRSEASAAFDGLIGDARKSPQDLQLALLEHGIENVAHTLQHLCDAVGKKFGVQDMGQGSLPDTSGLAKAVDDPKSIYPYASSIDFEQPVSEILLANRGDERDFPLLEEEKAILRKALDNFFHQKGTFVQRRTYEDLLSVLAEKGQPLAVATDQCNAALHAGSAFRTPKGLLADLAMEILQDHSYTHEPTRQERQIALEVISSRRSNDKATRNAIWEAINTRLYAGQGSGRSKAFAKDLLEVTYEEWLRTKPAEPEQEVSSVVPQEILIAPAGGGGEVQQEVDMEKSFEGTIGGTSIPTDVSDAQSTNVTVNVTTEISPDLREIYGREFDVLEENAAHAISGKWGKASGGRRSHRVNDPVAWLMGCVTHSVPSRGKDDSGLRTVVAEYAHRRSVNQDMRKEEYIRRRAGAWQSSPPVEQVPTPILDVAQVSTAPVAVATEEQIPGHPNADTQAVAKVTSEEVQPSITIPDVPVQQAELITEANSQVAVPDPVSHVTDETQKTATLEDHMEAELPIAIAEWQRLQRTKIERVLALLPETSVLLDFEKEFQSLDETIRHANDCVVKTHDALQEHAAHIVRMARTRKRADVVGDFEAFAADFVRLNQFLNTLTAHGNSIKALCDASEACENLLEKIDDAREHSREAEVFFEKTLPEITAGLSPVDLGLIGHDKANGNGGEGILRRLETLKRDIPPMHELCETEYEFEDEERREQYAEEVGNSVQAMSSLFKKLTGVVYSTPPGSTSLLVASQQDESAVQAQPPVENPPSTRREEPISKTPVATMPVEKEAIPQQLQ